MENIKVMNSILKFLSLLLCIWILSPCSHADIPSVDSVFSLHRHPVINKINNWKEIDLVYENRLLHSRNDNSKTSAGCVSSYNTAAKILFRCKEHIMLLRPDKVIKHWLKEQRQAGYINLTIKEFGLTNTRAYISAIKPASISQKCYLQLFSKSNKTNYSTESSCVTGVFKRHVDDVNSYTFKNLLTGNTETIHATPNHLFYVKNRRRFIALDEITPTDELLNLSGHQMRLLCPKGKKKHCGMIWKKFNISAVYNLEVYKEHQYFAGNNDIYVHNVYICLNCQKEFDYLSALKTHQKENEDCADISYRIFTYTETQKRPQYNLTQQKNIACIKENYPFQCLYCLDAFFKKDYFYDRHLSCAHPPAPLTYALPALPQVYPYYSAPVIIPDSGLSASIEEWNRVNAIATAQYGNITVARELSNAYRRMEGNLPEAQKAAEENLTKIYGTLKRELPEISAQEVDQLLPGFN